jgi:WD40 repeat protein
MRPLSQLSACALSRDGTRVVIAAWQGKIYVWNYVTDAVECKLVIGGIRSEVGSVAFSHDGSCVVSGSHAGDIRIWDCGTKSEISRYQHSSWVACVAFSRDDRRVVFGTWDRTVQIWNPATGQIETKIETPHPMSSVAFSHDNSYVVCGSSETAWIWIVTPNGTYEYTMSSGRLQLPDGTCVHSLGYEQHHIYDPVDQEATNNTLAYLLSINENEHWIIGEQAAHSCWIPPQYQDLEWASIGGSTVCLSSDSCNLIILDLKRTRHVHGTSVG